MEKTERIQKLLDNLLNLSLTDRSEEWFRHNMFGDVGNEDCSLIERRAMAFQEMLRAMVNPENSKKTHTYEIKPGELLVGTIPMGSVGLGKVFPNYLSDEEKRLLGVTNRDMQSTFGHNIPGHAKVLENGLKVTAAQCSEKLKTEVNENSQAFYRAVLLCCEAVHEYAEAFANLAEADAAKEQDAVRREELTEIARICRKVPWEPADSFYEAIQSVYFIHAALHSTLDYVSLGRLDQLLDGYLQQDLKKGIITEERALELYECLLIKCAERLNSNPAYFEKLDHASFGGVFGVSSVFLDQIASANNFLQNITLGGLTVDGKDACNQSTSLIMEACANLGLTTPIVNLRIGKSSPKHIIQEAVRALRKGRNGMPVIMNDDIIVPGLVDRGIAIEDSRDYGADGCWEPILNAKCDWVFCMVNFLSAMELALNSGCSFTTDPSLLRGVKVSYRTHAADRIKDFDELMDILKTHIQFYMDRSALTAYAYYSVEGSVTPTPFLSALMDDCMDKGLDKTWGGTQYNIIGTLGVGLPNCANALINIEKYVFEEKRYTLQEVVTALKNNYEGHEEMRNLFQNSEYKFGNNNRQADEMMRRLLDIYYECGMKAKELADSTFVDLYNGEQEKKAAAHRAICGYEGNAMKKKYGEDFSVIMNMGCGTFGQYTLMGKSNGASADGRLRGDALAANFSPSAGTMTHGIGNALETFENLGMSRFSAGVVMDFCIDDTQENRDDEYYERMLETFLQKQGNIITMSFVRETELKEAFEACEKVRGGENPDILNRYGHIGVRVGGFNAPYITLPREQQMKYLEKVSR